MQIRSYNQILSELASFKYVIIDKKVSNLYPDLFRAMNSCKVYFLENPEASKNLADYEVMLNFFLENGVTRNDEVLVIGGGATSDLGGFVAATALRGIGWTVVPTTLLSMIDAAIGGKVGVNSKYGKNLIGNFHHPSRVLLCSDFLQTLPEEELLSGKGELLKYCILSHEIFEEVRENYHENRWLVKCARFKESITNADFRESGERKILNLGHTFGHAFEKCLNLPHGIAVVYGLKLIIELYVPTLYREFVGLTEILEIELQELQCDFEEFKNYLLRDKKKVSNEEIELIIPGQKPGKVTIEKMNINKVLNKILNYEQYSNYFL